MTRCSWTSKVGALGVTLVSLLVLAGGSGHARPRVSSDPVCGGAWLIHLVDGAGRTIRLLGVDRSGSEYECLTGTGVFDGPTGPG